MIGLAVRGVHANGFTLVRRVLEDEDYDGPICWRRPVSTSTTCAGCAAARVRSRTSPAAACSATSRACCRTASPPTRLGRLGAAARLPTGSPATSTRTSCARLQPRHRLLRGGRRAEPASSSSAASSARDRRPGERRGNEPPGAARRRPAGRRRRLEPPRRPRARRAAAAGVPADAFELDDFSGREQRDAAMADWLEEQGAAGSCAPATCTCSRRRSRPLPGRIVNTHSAPLPDFPGAHPIEDVLAAGVAETAATVHYVDEGVDTGAVIAAEPVRSSRRHARDAARPRPGGGAPALPRSCGS